MTDFLPEPAVYTPFDAGDYSVSARLRSLEKDCGNGSVDAQVFQLDNEVPRFLQNESDARREDLSKYYGELGEHESTVHAVSHYIAEQLVREHPTFFQSSGHALHCALTGEKIAITNTPSPYVSPFDALASQVQEDLAVLRVADGQEQLVALHVTAPSYWDPSKKLGLNFADIHAPVPGMRAVNRGAPALLTRIAEGGAYQRFGWGLSTDRRLNHHPDPPADFAGGVHAWRGRRFNAANPKLYVRVERQVLVGVPAVSALLFAIRVYFVDCTTLSHDLRTALCDALHSMPPETRAYKGLGEDFDHVCDWLKAAE